MSFGRLKYIIKKAFGTPIVLPNKFYQGDEFSVDEIVKKLF
jgi:hypothetical protein